MEHFSHHNHPLVFNEDERKGLPCHGCREPVLGSSYSCIKCKWYYHHKSCAELPLGLHHPLHPKHTLVLFDESRYDQQEEYSKCKLCKTFRYEYTYRCSHCDFNLHNKCISLLPIVKTEVHDDPLTLLWKLIKFTCNLCGKEGDGMPYLCGPCGFWIHISCASFPNKAKVVRHKHPLNLTHSTQIYKSDSPFCQLCVQKVDTDYGFYYCMRCDFITHLDCAMDKRNKDIDLLELKDKEIADSETMLGNEDLELNEFVDSKTSKTYEVIFNVEDETKIKHFSHEHNLKLIDEVPNNEKCNGCARAILPPFYSCAKCNFSLHKSCVELPRKIEKHPLHGHELTLLQIAPYGSNLFICNACEQYCSGFTYNCEKCQFDLDVKCSLISDILTHKGHEHRLNLSTTSYEQKCNNCNFTGHQVFRCTTCEFVLDFKCATLPPTTMYKNHEHPFTLCYTAEDDSGEYYCDICEEERDPKHWFYYCADCSYPAHPKCILGKYPNCKFGGAYKFGFHQHTVTLIEKAKDHPQCNRCDRPCKELIYQCATCKFNIHKC